MPCDGRAFARKIATDMGWMWCSLRMIVIAAPILLGAALLITFMRE